MTDRIRDPQLEMLGVNPDSIKKYVRASWLGAESGTSEQESMEGEKEAQKQVEEEQLRAGYVSRRIPRKAVDQSVMPLGGVQVKHPKEDEPE